MVSMTDESAFEVGRNLAVTPGAVIYQNDFMQLIQYRPQTEEVYRAPAGDRPALHQQVLHPRPAAGELLRASRRAGRPHGVHGLVAQHAAVDGSRHLGRLPRAWRHARTRCSARDLRSGQGERARFLRRRNAARLRARGARAQQDERVASLTLLTSMLDFHDTGELSVFVDEAYVRARERDFARAASSRGASSRSPSQACVRTISSGSTW
jgi:polyhydroxyalkanoate synthase subunit PhaC